ncbi:MAG: BPL-N domain-containing protein [Planctomycetota bacterium]
MSVCRTSVFEAMKQLALCVFLALAGSASAQTPIRVAVFEGDGVGRSVTDLIDTLSTDQVEVHRFSADRIRLGELDGIDVLVHPGGSGSRQGKALGPKGRQAVREFVDQGGGFLGVCAGSYLATNDYSWSLNLIDAKVLDRRHWARGKGTVQLELSPNGSSFFGIPSEIDLYYGQGPLLARREWDDADVPNYESLAIYKSEIAENGAPKGVMIGTSAIVRSEFGGGRVFCFSPHPELTQDRGTMLIQAVRWLAKAAEQVTCAEPSGANESGARFASSLETLLASAKQTSYQHTTSIDPAEGIVRCDCSGLVGYVLRHEFPEAYLALRGDQAPWRLRPVAVTYYETFQAASSDPQAASHWCRVPDLRQVRPGDVIAWRKKVLREGSTTGHVCTIASNPMVLSSDQVRVRLIDSTRSPHEHDTRPEGTDGLGSGWKTFYVGPGGEPLGYFKEGRRIETELAVGRLSDATVGPPKTRDAQFIGLTQAQAAALAKSLNLPYRVIRVDGVPKPVRWKIDPERVNLVLEKDVVIHVLRG